jgi:transcriptional regulator with XRE-family HTH domain
MGKIRIFQSELREPFYEQCLRRRLSRRLEHLREERGWSRAYVAERIGVPCSRLAKWEQGRHAPGVADLALLASAYEISLDELVHGTAPPADAGGTWLREAADLVARLHGLLRLEARTDPDPEE